MKLKFYPKFAIHYKTMAIELKIPSVGESVTQVTIAAWLKQDGDYVEMDEAVAELESDKATVELNAEKSGILKILIEEGEDVGIGVTVATIDTDAAAPEGTPAKAEAPEAPPNVPGQIIVIWRGTTKVTFLEVFGHRRLGLAIHSVWHGVDIGLTAE